MPDIRADSPGLSAFSTLNTPPSLPRTPPPPSPRSKPPQRPRTDPSNPRSVRLVRCSSSRKTAQPSGPHRLETWEQCSSTPRAPSRTAARGTAPRSRASAGSRCARRRSRGERRDRAGASFARAHPGRGGRNTGQMSRPSVGSRVIANSSWQIALVVALINASDSSVWTPAGRRRRVCGLARDPNVLVCFPESRNDAFRSSSAHLALYRPGNRLVRAITRR